MNVGRRHVAVVPDRPHREVSEARNWAIGSTRGSDRFGPPNDDGFGVAKGDSPAELPLEFAGLDVANRTAALAKDSAARLGSKNVASRAAEAAILKRRRGFRQNVGAIFGCDETARGEIDARQNRLTAGETVQFHG